VNVVTASEPDNAGYTLFSFGFVSTGGSVTVSFIPDDYSAQPNDNVSVAPLPEPSFVWLLVSLLAMMMFRRPLRG
jgi:hypothetical protein